MDLEGNIVCEPVHEELVPGAFHLHNVLTADECRALINKTEGLGYDDSTHKKYQSEKIDRLEKKNRSNTRLVINSEDDDTQHAEIIFSRVKQFLPKTIYDGKYDLSGINTMFRFYRYEQGQQFGAHFDNQFVKTYSERSHMSFLLYLNDDFEGGETTFFKWNEEQKKLLKLPVHPIQGSALVFYHTGKMSPLHEGTPHTSEGKLKYVLRSDVMYKEKDVDE
mmetsp:Transcript_4941/g.6922  ORF Transcript_4941/g.6922 Transcript_4941/m.6922 type:complete len:221 (-) Transcript_4941:31-693(-)